MKVLLLPVNIASDISHKVRALNRIGVDARGFSLAESRIQTATNVTLFSMDYRPGKIARLRRVVTTAQIWRMIAAADVLHWIADANIFADGWNYRFLRRINKPGVVQWMGSDVRNPEIESEINPFYQQTFADSEYRKTESAQISRRNQQFAHRLGFYPLEFVGIGHYIDSQLFPKRFKAWQSIVLSEHAPRFPVCDRAKKPLVVHSPSAPVAKGTKYVLQAVEKLKTKYEFDFKLVQNMSRQNALETMSECDVYVDQLISGAHGYAAVEAMAFGKPVICYINPIAGKDYPADLPIVNANPETIEEKLETLIRDAILRQEIGKRSRAYAEKHHDDANIARELVRVYTEVIALHRQRKARTSKD